MTIMAPTFRYVGVQTDLSTLTTPPSGEFWIGMDASGNPAVKDDAGTITAIDQSGGSGIFSDSGSDNADGGNIIQAPNAEDSLDMRQGEVRAEQVFMNYIETTSVARDDRPLTTTRPRSGRTGEADKIHVDPGNGDDGLATRNVDAANPLDSLGEALARIPHIVEHEFVIKLQDGTYSGPVSLSTAPMHLTTWNVSGVIPSLRIEGNNTTPSNVVLDYPSGVNFAFYNAETDDGGGADPPEEAMISGCQFDGYINNKGGLLSISNCIFTGADTNAAIFGKAGGKTHVYDTEFQSGLNHVADLGNINAEVQLTNCTGTVSQQVLDLERGASAYMNRSGTTPGSDEGVFDINNGGRYFHRDGRTWPAKEQLVDDFDDGRLFNRRVSGDQHFYRVQWEAQSGSPTGDNANGVAVLPDGQANGTQNLRYSDLPNRFSEWELDFQAQSTPTTGRLVVYANGFGTADRNGWQFEVQGGGNLHVDKWDSQTETADVITGSWTPDTSWHSLRLTNDGSGGIEAFFDGSSIGTHSSSALDLQSNFIVVNELDAEVWADNVYVN